jgi:hypothetical protein
LRRPLNTHRDDLNAKLSEQMVRPVRRGEDPMMSRVAGTAAVLASFFFYAVSAANGQTPAEASRSSAVASPTYVSLYMEVTVNRPAADVWKRFGGYCAVAEWMKTPCTITSGKDGELGAVRTLGGGEVLVGKTPASYTYTQPVKDGQPYNLYHGTFEARPVTTTTSKLIYAFVYDNFPGAAHGGKADAGDAADAHRAGAAGAWRNAFIRMPFARERTIEAPGAHP